jgi:hypothetical protein
MTEGFNHLLIDEDLTACARFLEMCLETACGSAHMQQGSMSYRSHPNPPEMSN